jgi:hypothetical protein
LTTVAIAAALGLVTVDDTIRDLFRMLDAHLRREERRKGEDNKQGKGLVLWTCS